MTRSESLKTGYASKRLWLSVKEIIEQSEPLQVALSAAHRHLTEQTSEEPQRLPCGCIRGGTRICKELHS